MFLVVRHTDISLSWMASASFFSKGILPKNYFGTSRQQIRQRRSLYYALCQNCPRLAASYKGQIPCLFEYKTIMILCTKRKSSYTSDKYQAIIFIPAGLSHSCHFLLPSRSAWQLPGSCSLLQPHVGWSGRQLGAYRSFQFLPQRLQKIQASGYWPAQ